jgi:anti-sigma factor RsiW
MRQLDCDTALRQLADYLDGELLSVEEQIAVEAHLEICPPCDLEARELRDLRRAVRLGATNPVCPVEQTAAMQATVLSRVRAEQEQSLFARVRRMFEDMHFVWAGLSATAATLTCAVLLLAIGYFTPAERADSLAGILSALSSPGSNRNPVSIDWTISPPRVVGDGLVPAMLVSGTHPEEEDLVFALAAVVTQEGRIAYPEVLLANRRDRATVTRLMNAVLEARFEPASHRGNPVAVNFVWLLTHTTVRAKTHS